MIKHLKFQMKFHEQKYQNDALHISFDTLIVSLMSVEFLAQSLIDDRSQNLSDMKPELLVKLGNWDPPKNFKLNREKELH